MFYYMVAINILVGLAVLVVAKMALNTLPQMWSEEGVSGRGAITIVGVTATLAMVLTYSAMWIVTMKAL